MCILAAGGPVLERLGRLATAWAASLLPGQYLGLAVGPRQGKPTVCL